MSTTTDMKGLKRARGRLLALLIVMLAVWAVALAGVWVLHTRVRRVRRERDTARVELERLRRMEDGRSLDSALARLRAEHQAVQDRWEHLRFRSETFKDRFPFGATPDDFGNGRIDFKVTLYDARRRLTERALEARTDLPEDLGITEDLFAQENPRTRFWQLACIVKFVELLMDANVHRITTIEPRPPMAHALPGEEGYAAYELPVRLVSQSSYRSVCRLLERLSRADPFFALRAVQMKKTHAEAYNDLEVDLTVGSIIFSAEAGALTYREMLESGREGGL